MNSHGALRFSTELKKLYPEDFVSSNMSEARIAAFNDSIQSENKPGWILRWVAGKDYTVLFCDHQGEFAALYEERFQKEWRTEAQALYAVPMGEPALSSCEKPFSVWRISGTKGHVSNVSVCQAESGLMIQ